MTQRITKTVLCFLCLSIITLYGCAGTPKKIIEAEPIENHMEKIAVVGESKIYFPRTGQKPPLLDLGMSKKVFDLHFQKTEDILKEKGYEVLYAQPAAVGYFYINQENWVFEDYHDSENKWQIKK